MTRRVTTCGVFNYQGNSFGTTLYGGLVVGVLAQTNDLPQESTVAALRREIENAILGSRQFGMPIRLQVGENRNVLIVHNPEPLVAPESREQLMGFCAHYRVLAEISNEQVLVYSEADLSSRCVSFIKKQTVDGVYYVEATIKVFDRHDWETMYLLSLRNTYDQVGPNGRFDYPTPPWMTWRGSGSSHIPPTPVPYCEPNIDPLRYDRELSMTSQTPAFVFALRQTTLCEYWPKRDNFDLAHGLNQIDRPTSEVIREALDSMLELPEALCVARTRINNSKFPWRALDRKKFTFCDTPSYLFPHEKDGVTHMIPVIPIGSWQLHLVAVWFNENYDSQIQPSGYEFCEATMGSEPGGDSCAVVQSEFIQRDVERVERQMQQNRADAASLLSEAAHREAVMRAQTHGLDPDSRFNIQSVCDESAYLTAQELSPLDRVARTFRRFV